MRFIHIADVHLGAEPEAGKRLSGKRGRELWGALERVLEICEEEQTDLLLIAGDLFHRQPLLRELKEVNYLFSRLTHTKVVLIAGNHDHLKKGSYYLSFEWSENVFPLFRGELDCVQFPELETAVYGFSYEQREIREPKYDSVQAQGLCKYEILLAHGGDEKHIPIRRETFVGNGFAYVALGHIHKPQAVVKGKVLYAGALEPTDRNDMGRHGMIRGEITEQGVQAKFVPLAKREYVLLELEVHEQMTAAGLRDTLASEIERRGKQHFYQVILRGFHAPEAWWEFEQLDRYGNLIGLQDETEPAYDLQRLWEENEDNLLGKYIARFADTEKDSVERAALYEGVQALLQSEKGR